MVLNSAFCWWWNCRLLDDPQDILSRICSVEPWPTYSASHWFENQPMVCLNQPTNVSFKELWCMMIAQYMGSSTRNHFESLARSYQGKAQNNKTITQERRSFNPLKLKVDDPSRGVDSILTLWSIERWGEHLFTSNILNYRFCWALLR